MKLFFKDPIFASLVGAAAPSKAFHSKGFLQDLNSLIILVAWELWKHQNVCVFEGARPSIEVLLPVAEPGFLIGVCRTKKILYTNRQNLFSKLIEFHKKYPSRYTTIKALFSCKKNYKIDTIAFSFVFDKYCPTID